MRQITFENLLIGCSGLDNTEKITAKAIVSTMRDFADYLVGHGKTDPFFAKKVIKKLGRIGKALDIELVNNEMPGV